jgi:hypothetical protein
MHWCCLRAHFCKRTCRCISSLSFLHPWRWCRVPLKNSIRLHVQRFRGRHSSWSPSQTVKITSLILLSFFTSLRLPSVFLPSINLTGFELPVLYSSFHFVAFLRYGYRTLLRFDGRKGANWRTFTFLLFQIQRKPKLGANSDLQVA